MIEADSPGAAGTKLADKLRETLERIRAQEREIRTLKDKLASGQGTDLAAGAVDVAGTKVIAARVEGADSASLRNAVDQLKSRLGSAIIVLAAVESPTKFSVAGIDKQQVGEVAANIRKIRKPEPYKGKGVRYAGEVVRRKAGKTGKK